MNPIWNVKIEVDKEFEIFTVTIPYCPVPLDSNGPQRLEQIFNFDKEGLIQFKYEIDRALNGSS